MSKAKTHTVGSIIFALCMLGFFVTTFMIARGYPESASLAPVMVGVLGIAATLLQVGVEFIENRRAKTLDVPADHHPAPTGAVEEVGDKSLGREIELASYFIALVAAILLFGFWIATPIFIAVFLRLRERVAWIACLLSAIAAEVVIYLMFWKLLQIQLFSGFVFKWLHG